MGAGLLGGTGAGLVHTVRAHRAPRGWRNAEKLISLAAPADSASGSGSSPLPMRFLGMQDLHGPGRLEAIQTHGGNGVAREYNLTNYWFLARLLLIAPVSREMVLNFVAEHSLGLPRSY